VSPEKAPLVIKGGKTAIRLSGGIVNNFRAIPPAEKLTLYRGVTYHFNKVEINILS